MTEHLLDIRVERKTFATTTVLKHIHLQLKPRETVNLLGPGTRRATGSPARSTRPAARQPQSPVADRTATRPRHLTPASDGVRVIAITGKPVSYRSALTT